MNALSSLTPEQRAYAQEKKKEKREAGLAMFKTSWADDSYWLQLAKEANVKLAHPHIAPSGIKLDKFAKQLKLSDNWAEGFFGVTHQNTTKSIKLENARRKDGEKYPMRLYQGLLLELWKENQNVQ